VKEQGLTKLSLKGGKALPQKDGEQSGENELDMGDGGES